MNAPFNVMAHICDAGERWIFIFTDDQRLATLSTIAKYALDDDLSLTKEDADRLGEKLYSAPERFTLVD